MSGEKLPFSFEEFVKNRDKYIGRDDEAFGWIDKGSTQLGRYVRNQIYEIEGYRCDSLERVDEIASRMGYTRKELECRPEIIPLSGHKCDILCRFFSKETIKKREAWR